MIFGIEVTGINRELKVLAQLYPSVQRSLRSTHVTATRELYKVAQANLDASIKRPQEKGIRASTDPKKGRMTGRFTFGRGRAFQARLIHNTKQHLYGLGFPDVGQADAVTSGIWRVLEFGLPTVDPEYGSPGQHILPRRWVFADLGEGDVFFPGKGPVHPSREGGGVPPKFFLTEAWLWLESAYLPNAYQRALDRAVERLS